MKTFKSFIVREEGKEYIGSIENKQVKELPVGDVLIEVKYSSLNYKDALSASGNKGVTRSFPHTPGIDAAGIVAASNDNSFKVGDEVLVTGYDLGMNTSGGYQEYIRVPKEWVVPLPKELTLKESMIIGTAGFTAALSVFKMINAGTKVSDGDILVTGATGGVGSVAVAILSKLGYSVVAATGKVEKTDFLLNLGAKEVIDRNEINDESKRPLLKAKYAGVIDTVGGNILSTAIKSTKYDGNVTTCGLTQSSNFESSVFPFILKGVSLLGVDSVMCPMELRLKVWELLSTTYKIDSFDEVVNEISLNDLNEYIQLILEGKSVGRNIVVM
jgi:putative YhdH/YhfP family quinone oxidoreductase